MRASDADRDRIAEVLGDSFVAGRLTPEEHGQRLDALYAAKTLDELQPLVADLPVKAPGSVVAPQYLFRVTRATLAKVRRSGQWTVPPESVASARFGAVILDLCHASFAQQTITIDAESLFGRVEIIVPENARVFDSGVAFAGKRTLPDSAPVGDDGPVIHIQGRSRFGKLFVHRGPQRQPWKYL